MGTVYKEVGIRIWAIVLVLVLLQLMVSTALPVYLVYIYFTYIFKFSFIHYYFGLFWLLICLELFVMVFVIIGGKMYKSIKLNIDGNLQKIDKENLEKYFVKTIFFSFSRIVVSKVWYPGVIFFYREYGAKIGKNVDLDIDVGIGTPLELVEIGENSLVSFGSILAPHVQEDEDHLVGKIKIGRNCVIGFNSIILPDATIGDKSIVGANSLVLKKTRIPSEEVWVGSPARRIRKTSMR